MASPLGPLVKEQPYISTIPFDLVAQVGQYKQGLYNQAIAQGQQRLNDLVNQELYKQYDADYVNSKVKETTEKLNQFAGMDLSKQNINSQLENVISDAYTDPEFTRRIIANKKYGQQQAVLQDIMKNHPEKYSDTNFKLYQQQVNKWMEDPNQLDFDAEYHPYYDTSKVLDDAVKPVLDHPQVYQIDKTWEGGNASQEVKEAAADRLQEAMIASLKANGQAMGQLQIDYEATKDLRTPQMAKDMLDGKISAQQSLIDDANTVLSNGESTQAQKDAANAQIRKSNGIISTINKQKQYIDQTGDISQVYSFDNYVDDTTYNKARALAYREVGPVKVDEISKLRYDRETAALQAQWKQQADQAKENAKKNAAMLPIYNPMLTNFKTLGLDGKATFKGNEVRYLLNNTGKLQDDGSFTINLSNDDVRLNKIHTDPATATAIDNISKYGIANSIDTDSEMEWAAKNIDFIDKQIPGFKISVEVGTGGKPAKVEDIKRYVNYNVFERIAGNPGKTANIERLNKLWAESKEGKALREKLKNDHGVDLSENTVNGVQLTSDQQEESKYYKQLLPAFKGMNAQLKFVPVNNDNVERAADGSIWVSGTAMGTYTDLKNGIIASDPSLDNGSFFTGDSAARKLLDAMIDKGVLQYKDPGKDKKQGTDDDIYGAPLTIKSSMDPLQANGAYLQNEVFAGDKANAEYVPEYMSQSQNQMSQILALTNNLELPGEKTFGNFLGVSGTSGSSADATKAINDYFGDDASKFKDEIGVLTTGVSDKKDGGIIGIIWNSDDPKETKQALTNQILKAYTVAKDPMSDPNSRIKAMQMISDLKGAKSVQDIVNIGKKLKGEPTMNLPDMSSKLEANVPALKAPPEKIAGYFKKYSAQYGVPEKYLQALAFRESSYNPNKHNSSGDGGLGLYQFGRTTANEYGLKDRTDPDASTKAAAQYLLKAYHQFNDWDLAVASFNGGIGRISQAMYNTSQWDPRTVNHTSAVLYYVNQLNNINQQ